MSDSQNFNLNDADGGRAYIAHLFKAELKRHDYRQYIAERLAGDFACTLAQYFEDIKAREAALQQRLTAADERIDVLEELLREAATTCRVNDLVISANYFEAALKPTAQTNTSGKSHCPHDGICHTSDETCAEAVVRVESIKPTTCAWQYGAFSWRTSCGEEWMLNDGTPDQNGMHFCHSCGKTLVVSADQSESEQES